MPEEEKALLEQLQAGDSDAWRAVLEELTPQLHGYASRLLNDPRAAEEVVQEAFVSVYRAIEKFEGRASFKSWMFRAVHHRAVDELRRRRRYIPSDDVDADQQKFESNGKWKEAPVDWEEALGAQLDARKLAKVVGRELDALPHDYRQVLLLKEVHGLETDAVCETLDITPANLRVRLHRARKALRAAVDATITSER